MIKVKATNLDKALRRIKTTQNKTLTMTSRIMLFTQKLAEIGVGEASIRFQQAQYDGTNDVIVEFDREAYNKVTVIAKGKATLFIEFGTGIHYPDDHPLASRHGMKRGEYGKKQGKKEKWVYYGEAGTNGTVLRTSDRGDVVRTRGNPASRSMYLASKEIRDNITKIAKEVFA